MSTKYRIIHSALDKSFNIIYPHGVEARWVHRGGDKASVYVSSHDNCNMGCKMCHLTDANRQGDIADRKKMRHVDVDMYSAQTYDVIAEAIRTDKMHGISRINVNFMARGDVFANKFFRKDPIGVRVGIVSAIHEALNGYGIPFPDVKLNISSIFPKTIEGITSPSDRITLDELIGGYRISPRGVCRDHQGGTVDDYGITLSDYDIPLHSTVEVYLSLYTMDEKKRKWLLPSAMSAADAMRMISETSLPCTIHHAYIRGFNDDVSGIIEGIKEYGLTYPRVRHNAVRYNPSAMAMKTNMAYEIATEADEAVIYDNVEKIKAALGEDERVDGNVRHSKVIRRVGFDVKASCGMFVV